MSKFERGTLTATIIAMYQKSSLHLDDVLLHLRHEYDDIVEGNLHLHIGGGDNCAEIFVTEGNAERVSNFIGRIRASQIFNRSIIIKLCLDNNSILKKSNVTLTKWWNYPVQPLWGGYTRRINYQWCCCYC